MTKTADEVKKLEIFHANFLRFRKELSDFLAVELTDQALADASGINVDTIRQYTRGVRRAELDYLEKLADTFGRPMEHFSTENPPAADKTRMRRFFVRLKTIGNAPPGLEEELARVLKKYTPDEAERRSRLKKEAKKPRR